MNRKLITFFLTLFLIAGIITIAHTQYTYTLTPDYADYIKIPVNIEKQLTATVRDSSGMPPSGSIAVTVKPQWTYEMVCYTDVNGRISFTVKAPQSGVYTITYSSTYFQTVVSYVQAVPATYLIVDYDANQYLDPIQGQDITANITVKESEANSVIPTPDSWSMKVLNSPSGSVVTLNAPTMTEPGKYMFTADVVTNTCGQYVIQIEASYGSYYVQPSNITVTLNNPIIVVTYKFETGESITLKPDQAGQGITVKQYCSSVSMYFTDAKGRPVDVYFEEGTHQLEVISSTAMFTRQAGEVNVERVDKGIYLLHFPLVESWYIIKPYMHGFIGSYDVRCETEVKIATIREGFKPEQWLFSPYILIPIVLIAIVIIGRIFSRKKKTEQ